MAENIRYMASWLEQDVVTENILELPKKPIWEYWNGRLKRGQEPPKRVMILATGLIYNWQDFQKVRIK
jgi:hypothetical protein